MTSTDNKMHPTNESPPPPKKKMEYNAKKDIHPLWHEEWNIREMQTNQISSELFSSYEYKPYMNI